ncbi:serine/threonine protein kinase ppk15, putative [Entamoeba dispar SAW760]|uniref:Serine/threonine protein kinase ppk15, putative n=1 Tax=Entamoeba dispar (strain ATCC PRA-260 / SAW760) TaxID=370354 RepID=B0EPZ3_ENTDS|nr:serine/threonine protein kinase ppk15, putative [Entamoeba dispar SAW760]EDR23405.1 serine/threonine protein kinase ppk15, putative [Entamoeba dispar SAW760]|eukprot:EDR23405.1 serine/threonine protein kinase ppk15, putative [Entamoeba dispar SAW760]
MTTITSSKIWKQPEMNSHEKGSEVNEPVTKKLTTGFIHNYQKCNPQIDFNNFIVRRILTVPSTPLSDNQNDNECYDLIVRVDDILGADFSKSELNGLKKNSQYRVIGLLGQGSFGEVFRCLDLQTNQLVAVKILKNQLVYLRQGMLELAILTLLNGYYDPIGEFHTIRMMDHFMFKSHLCIVFELLSINLYDALKMNDYKGLPYNFNQSVCKQLVCSLQLLRENGIIHCDIKPENIMLLASSSKIRLIDFGSACFQDSPLYTYIQSRHYRSPEIIIGLPYSPAIDMWSFGCVVAELFLGIPLFAGSSEHNQLSKIIQLIGMPSTTLLKKGSRTDEFFWRRRPSPKIVQHENGEVSAVETCEDEYFVLKTRYEYEKSMNTHIIANKNYFNETTLEGVIKSCMSDVEMNEEEADVLIDFLKKIFVYDPNERMTPTEALSHPFIKNIDINNSIKETKEIKEIERIRCVKLTGEEAKEIVFLNKHDNIEIYDAENYYRTYITALQHGIVLNILDPNPFSLPTLAVFHPQLGFAILLHKNNVSKNEGEFVPLPFNKSKRVAVEQKEEKTPIMTFFDGSTVVTATPVYNEQMMSLYEEAQKSTDDYMLTYNFDSMYN